MAVGNVPLTPIVDTVTGSVTEIGRIFLRTLAEAVGALAPIDASYWTSKSTAGLTAEQNLGALASGYLKIAVAIGIATPSTVAAIPQADVAGLVAALATIPTLPITEANVTNLIADLALKAPLASPTLTGTPAAPTAAAGTNSTQIATTAFVAALAALGQIAFPAVQNASANANTLDDYEEGTWTPTDASGAALVFTFPVAAQYVKVGQLVMATGAVQYPVTASGVPVFIGGLPFTNQATQSAAPIYYSTFGAALMGLVQVSSSNVTFYNVATAVQITNANFSNKDVRFTAIYRASA